MVPPSKNNVHGEWLYMRSSVPDTDVEDVKAMQLEKVINPDNPRGLYDRLPNATPSMSGGCSARLWKAIWQKTGWTK